MSLPFLFLLSTSLLDFLFTLHGVFLLDKTEKTHIVQFIIETFGFRGYVTSAFIYFLLLIYILKTHKSKSDILFIILGSIHFAGMLTWINSYTGFSIVYPYNYLLVSLSAPIAFVIGKRIK